MNRPAPRKSQLAGQTPASPAAPIPTPVPEARETAPAAVPSAATAAPIPTRQDRVTKAQLCAQVPVELIARVRGIVLHTTPLGGPPTIAAFMTQALEAYADQLEATFNDGEPYPAVRTGVIRTGRPPVY